MKTIGIIGGGFSGTLFALNLINKAVNPLELIIINERETFNKGVAFNPYSKRHLLNVPASKMSAFSKHPDHFLDWIMQQKEFSDKDKTLVGNSFLPRYLYGKYLTDLWNKITTLNASANLKIRVVNGYVLDLDVNENSVTILLNQDEQIVVDKCVIASGNNIPRNPIIKETSFFKNKNYFQNPWQVESVTNLNNNDPILILGNGLTMVDTALGLLENSFQNEIYSISPNGFNILPHRHNGLKYTKLIEELPETATLYEIVCLVNKHRKIVREFGLTAEPVIDSIRSLTQQIWQNLTTQEKRIFMSRLRHLWGVARHRIPTHIHDKIQQLRIDEKLHIISGKIDDITEEKDKIIVSFYNKKTTQFIKKSFSRIINCTGPETDLLKMNNSFLKNCLLKGIITQDELKLGINADPNSFSVIDKKGNKHQNLFTIGTNLKGVLWESTAVNELRKQAEKLADILVNKNLMLPEIIKVPPINLFSNL